MKKLKKFVFKLKKKMGYSALKYRKSKICHYLAYAKKTSSFISLFKESFCKNM